MVFINQEGLERLELISNAILKKWGGGRRR